jgi:hypothetical protein
METGMTSYLLRNQRLVPLSPLAVPGIAVPGACPSPTTAPPVVLAEVPARVPSRAGSEVPTRVPSRVVSSLKAPRCIPAAAPVKAAWPAAKAARPSHLRLVRSIDPVVAAQLAPCLAYQQGVV